MRVIRVLFGFVAACLAAAVTLVLFVYTPVELAGLPSGMIAGRVAEAATFALVISPHVATFAALPALVAVVAGERRAISSWTYYVLVGIGVAVLGFLTQHLTEAPDQTTILQNYALAAFLAAGFAGGFVYWLLSGRFLGRGPGARARDAGTPPAEALPAGEAPAPRQA
jgi:hypothetical protein